MILAATYNGAFFTDNICSKLSRDSKSSSRLPFFMSLFAGNPAPLALAATVLLPSLSLFLPMPLVTQEEEEKDRDHE